jgi:octaprenyl-diphosphate synthase
MCGLKTGCLARFAAELGTVAAETAGRPAVIGARALGDAAEKLGIGFQILDDVKNLTTGLPGKKRGDDIVEGKKSLPVLLFLHRLPDKKELVYRCFNAARTGGVTVPEVEELIQAFQAAGVLAEAGERGKSLIAEAREVFTGTGYPLLSGMVDQIS